MEDGFRLSNRSAVPFVKVATSFWKKLAQESQIEIYPMIPWVWDGDSDDTQLGSTVELWRLYASFGFRETLLHSSNEGPHPEKDQLCRLCLFGIWDCSGN